MKNLIIQSTLGLCVLSLVFFSSCKNDDGAPPVAPPDYSIRSSERFEVVETHENGWIKHAVRYNYNNEPLVDFEYWPSGHIKAASVYRDFPYSLWYEHSRSEDNLPESTKYYDKDGNLYAELFFENGIKVRKVVYFADQTTTTQYLDGEMEEIERVNTAAGTRTLVKKEFNGTASLQYFKNDELSHEGTLFETDLGAGYADDDDMPLLQPLNGAVETRVVPLNRGMFGSVSTYYSVLPQDYVEYPAHYEHSSEGLLTALGGLQGLHDMKAALNSDHFRELLEQYPLVESEVYITSASFLEDHYNVSNTLIEIGTDADEKREIYGEDFEPLHGPGYLEGIYKGKFIATIGTLRNLPSDETLRNGIKELAYQHMRAVLQNETPLTAIEQEMLSHVFMEIRTHSNVLEGGDRGIVIETHEDYEALIEAYQSANSVEVQRHFQPY